MLVKVLAPTAICVAPNGARRTQADHPRLPMSAKELARDAAAAFEAGAAMIHMHVRDAAGQHLLDVNAYEEATRAVRDAVGQRLVVQVTTEAVGRYTPQEQEALVRALRPEAVSIALREFVPTAAHERGFADLMKWMRAERIAPQIILYTPQEAHQLHEMMARGILDGAQMSVLFVLGRYSKDQQSEPTDLLPFVALDAPAFAHWSVCAFGHMEAACVTTAALLGGHVRVGFENNLFLPNGELAPDNAALVETVADTLKGLGHPLSDAEQLRAALLGA